MGLLDKLERRLGRYAIPNVTLMLIIGQAVAFMGQLSVPGGLDALYLVPRDVMNGEFWRLFTFLIVPPTDSVIFIIFALYLFYLMGTALESHWGALRYNLYLLIAWVMTVAAAWVAPDVPASNAYLLSSVFLAFAFLYPEFELLLFFILPVKVKWLALITWLFLAYTVLTGDWQTRALAVASVANFLVFFAPQIIRRVRYGQRRMASQTQAAIDRDRAFHVCAVCGITDKTHPQMDFRYCAQCGSDYAYCTEHLNRHEHKTKRI